MTGPPGVQILQDGSSVRGHATWKHLDKPAYLLVGSDCAGMLPEAYALKNLGVQHKTLFATEKDPQKQKIIKHLHGDVKIYTTVKDRNEDEDAPDVHLLTGGFPCQPFSSAGTHSGTSDIKRGIVVFEMFDYVAVHKPRLIVLENVSGLIYLHWAEFKDTRVEN